VAGLSAAIRMRAKGHEVTVFEANSYPGGKLTAFEQDGFRFDAGPSLFTMPHLLDEVFTSANKNPRDYYSFQKVDPGCHYFWEDGTKFAANSNPKIFAKEAGKTFGVQAKTVEDYIKHSGEVYDITEKVFLKSSLHKASTYLRWSTLRSLLKLHKANLFSTMNEVNENKLENEKLVQLFNRYATYNGSNPYKAPGTLTVIPTLEHRWGTFLPQGGMHEITQSMFRLAQDIGIDFHFEEKVERITTHGKSATGLTTQKDNYQFDKVVSNMDIVPTYRNLLPQEEQFKKVLNQERSSSALIFYWGIEKEFSELGLHNILWSEDYRDEFRIMFEEKYISSDPTVYINITSKFEKGDAPNGCENWFVMVNAPHVDSQDWETLTEQTRKNVISKVNRILNCNIEKHILTERVLDPQLIQSQTSSYLGALYGTSSNNRMSAFLRHPNFSGKIKNLYFCGGSVHPGGGIPLCLLSGKIVSDLAG
jgi:phytoene desaturase